MKCEHVQSVIVEYAERALCVADELCVDIHLIQCESCRRDLAEIAQWEASISGVVECVRVEPDTVGLLDKLDRLAPIAPPQESVTVRRLGASLFRFALAAGIVIAVLSTGAFTWHYDSPDPFGLMPAEAAARRPLVETLRPLDSAAGWKELDVLNELTGGALAPPEMD